MTTALYHLGRGYSRVSVRCLRPGPGPATTTTNNTCSHTWVANPKLVESADMLVMEDVCSPIVAPAVHDDMAADDVARILATAGERGSQ